MNLLEQISDQHLLTVIINLLADIKDNEFRKIVMRYIQNNASPATKTALLQHHLGIAFRLFSLSSGFHEHLQNDDFTTASKPPQ